MMMMMLMMIMMMMMMMTMMMEENGSDDGFHLQNVDEVVGFAWVSWQLKEDKFD